MSCVPAPHSPVGFHTVATINFRDEPNVRNTTQEKEGALCRSWSLISGNNLFLYRHTRSWPLTAHTLNAFGLDTSQGFERCTCLIITTTQGTLGLDLCCAAKRLAMQGLQENPGEMTTSLRNEKHCEMENMETEVKQAA